MWALVLPTLFLCLVRAASTGNQQVIRSVTDSNLIDPTKVITLSWQPRVFLYKSFLTDEECDHLINLAKGKLGKSLVVDRKTGRNVESTFRTSSGMFLRKAQDEIVKRVEDRIEAWTFIPAENGEEMQVLKYERGQMYEPHRDYFGDTVKDPRGGHRVATVLLYLSDVINGGETRFPLIEPLIESKITSECGRGLAVKPLKGDALLFYSLHPDNSPDEDSLHQGCPVLEGEKWSATKWLHVASFDRVPPGKSDPCDDEFEMYGLWAKGGQCQENPEFMLGTSTYKGSCRKTCKAC